MRYLVCGATALLFCVVGAGDVFKATGAQPIAVEQYLIKFSLRNFPPAGSSQPGVVLAEPQLVVLAGRQANFRVGGEQTAGEIRIPVGTNLTATVSSAGVNKVRITGKLEIATAKTLDDNDIVSRESFEVHFDKTVELGKPKRICISTSSNGARWFELLVEQPGIPQPGSDSIQPATAKMPTDLPR